MAKTKKTWLKRPTKKSYIKKLSFSKSRFWSTRTALFILVFATVGAYLIWRALAGTSTLLVYTDFNSSLSSGASIVTETGTSKNNTEVVEIISGSTTKAVFSSTTKGLDAGSYKACLIAKSISSTSSGTMKVSSLTNGTLYTLASGSYSLTPVTDYNKTGCLNINLVTATPGLQVVVRNASGGNIRVGSIVISPVSNPNPPVDFTPTVIPKTTELANPYRGSYAWQGVTPQPAGWPIEDSYLRYTWRQLEPTRGNYNFSAIDNQLAAAKARGGKFGLRIKAACTGCENQTNLDVPDYLVSLMPKGWWFTKDNSNNYAPDWNDPDYLSRLQALLQALGARYNNDPRLGFIDISTYGDFGEWHTFNWPPSPTGATKITPANAEAIVDMNIAAFPNKLLLMQHQTDTSDNSDDDHVAFIYALNKSTLIGIRNDCLGSSWFDSEMNYLFDHYPIVANRWKTAPTMTEPCGGGFDKMATQIPRFHVDNIGNGNFGSLSRFTTDQQNQWKQNNIDSGYRFILNQLTMPNILTRDLDFGVTSKWSNVGVTPAYNPWDVTLQLRNPSTDQVVWSGKSSVNLRSLLPGSTTTIDSFKVDTSVAAGSYKLTLSVIDPAGYYDPLKLAITGRASNGSYPLGTVTLQ